MDVLWGGLAGGTAGETLPRIVDAGARLVLTLAGRACGRSLVGVYREAGVLLIAGKLGWVGVGLAAYAVLLMLFKSLLNHGNFRSGKGAP